MGRLLDEPGSKSSLKMKAEPQSHECIHEDLFTSINRRLDDVETGKKDTDSKLDDIMTAVSNVDKKVDILKAVTDAVDQNKENSFNKTTTEIIVICTIIGSVCTIIGMIIGFKIF